MRTNRWQRFCIALSLAWALGAFMHQRQADVDRAERITSHAYKVCMDGKAFDGNADLASCDQEKEKSRAIWMEGGWSNAAVIALVPIPLAWLSVFILVHVGRAQAIGFKAVISWRELNGPRKAVVRRAGLPGLQGS